MGNLINSYRFGGVPDAPPESFSYTGSSQTTTVPPGQFFVTVDLVGAGNSGNGLFGGRMQGKIAVTPGSSVQINVGGSGTLSAGGFNGGGNPGSGSFNVVGGSGATDIRIGGTDLVNRIFVAAGSGGYGGEGIGNGGGSTGQAGTRVGGGDGGGGGTQIAGGAGGPAGTTLPGSAGSLGVGGDGAANTFAPEGGGGGGGYYGGGGGGDGQDDGDGGFLTAGGGGGSNFSNILATGVTSTQGYAGAGGNGSALLTWSVT